MRNIGIIGEGKMGTNLFNYLGGYDFSLRWIVSRDADITSLQKSFGKKMKRSLANEIISEKQYESALSNILISHDISITGDCDLVIEAVPEVLSLKKAILHQLDQITSTECILSTNSSSILPSDLVPSEERLSSIVGLHFFYPVSLKDVVEINRLHETKDDCIINLSNFLFSINKRPVILFPENAFILNRIFLDLQEEAFEIVNEGLSSFYEMDNLIKDHFTPTGVFEFCDHVGNDTMFASVVNYIRFEPEKDKYMPFMMHLNSLVQAGRLGKKTGYGFYSWSSGNPEIQENEAILNEEELIIRLEKTIRNSVRKFSERSNISEELLSELLKEYM